MALLLLSCVLLLRALSCCFAKGARAILGNPVKFPETGECEPEDGRAELWHVGASRNRLVAEVKRGVWMPKLEYQDRAHPGSTFGFTRTLYTDIGTYELICGDASMNIHLSVVFGFDAPFTPGQTVTFPCYGVVGADMDTVRWDKSGTTVLELSLSTGEATFGVGYEGRVRLMAEGSREGDWSLVVTRIEPDDEGDYYCSIRRGGVRQRWEELAAVKARNRRTTADPPLTSTATIISAERFWAFVATVVLTSLVVAPSCFLLGWCIRSKYP